MGGREAVPVETEVEVGACDVGKAGSAEEFVEPLVDDLHPSHEVWTVGDGTLQAPEGCDDGKVHGMVGPLALAVSRVAITPA